MPELPEVETIRRDLERLIVGKKILGVEVLSSKSFLGDPKKIIGKKIIAIKRRAKLLIIELDDTFLLIHLKLTGRLLVRHLSLIHI